MIETGKEATKALKAIRRKTGWSVRGIGTRLGINHTTVWLIYNGKVKNPSPEFLEAIDRLYQEKG